MAVYQICYDLSKEPKDHERVQRIVSAIGDVHHPLPSLWWVNVTTATTAHQVFEAVRHAFLAGDRVFVTAIPKGQYQGWLPEADWDWLRRRAG